MCKKRNLIRFGLYNIKVLTFVKMFRRMFTMFAPSCDTFVAFPPVTRNNFIVFGKNSDRPADEVQEIVTIPAKNHTQQELQVTFVIPQD